MYYIATCFGFLVDVNFEHQTFAYSLDVRFAKPFSTFEEADSLMKRIQYKKYYAILKCA